MSANDPLGSRKPPVRVALFVTCLVDLFRPSVGFAAIKLLESAGCVVEVPRRKPVVANRPITPAIAALPARSREASLMRSRVTTTWSRPPVLARVC